MNYRSKKIAFLGLCTAAALVLSYIENILPPLFVSIPGIKLGLPNIVIIFILYGFGIREASLVSFIRIVSISLLFGNPLLFAYSLSGAILSMLVMAVLRRLDLFSMVGVSVAGGISHNAGQILMAMLLLETSELGYYMLVLALTGTIAGIFVGLCGALLIKRIPLPKK